MYMNCDTKMRPSNSDENNQVHNSDINHKSMDTRQDDIGVNNANMP